MVETGSSVATPATAGFSPIPRHAPRVVRCRPSELRLHPDYVDVVPMLHVKAAESVDSAISHQPLVVVTSAGIVVDGQEQWQFAIDAGEEALVCLEHDLSDDEALAMIICRCRGQARLNAFCRIELALRLEPGFRGGHGERLRDEPNASSTLTNKRSVDVRRELAALAGVSTGNFTKVKQILERSGPDLVRAIRNGSVSIHRAWLWRELSLRRQQAALLQYGQRKSIDQSVRSLIARQIETRTKAGDECSGIDDEQILVCLRRAVPDSLVVVVVETPGLTLALSRELRDWLVSTVPPS